MVAVLKMSIWAQYETNTCMILSPVECPSDHKAILCFVLAKESLVPSRTLLYYLRVKWLKVYLKKTVSYKEPKRKGTKSAWFILVHKSAVGLYTPYMSYAYRTRSTRDVMGSDVSCLPNAQKQMLAVVYCVITGFIHTGWDYSVLSSCH